ncbi:two-component regulator propeller domain-containing protein [Pseudomarimonas arenosa]|uniref:histidine kinase n=1 Tax=Pseudomarimonas arenosa TaxID=2774145 RepID=A0AAW3ZN94_9GAMM|nr:two-component regulator propeller domain-containing protein [Pseudomarimonas arenosa]MBD8526102.1 GAF domain-containing protein [Pseudomarimonas arenosa]
MAAGAFRHWQRTSAAPGVRVDKQINRRGSGWRWLAALLLPLGLAQSAELNPEAIRFRHLDARNGLPQVSVLALVQDASGFVWIGTQDGLARYDGVEVRVFLNHRDRADSLWGNRVNAMALDQQGQLWVGSSEGLNRYLSHSETFQRIGSAVDDPGAAPAGVVRALAVDGKGDLWVGGRGLARVSAQGRVLDYLAHGDGRLPGEFVHALAPVADGSLWIGTSAGLAKRDAQGAQRRYPLAEEAPSVTALLHDRHGQLWVGTDGFGLYRLNVKGEIDRHWLPDAQPASLADGRIRSLLQDVDGRIWVGHESGLDVAEQPDAESVAWTHFRYQRPFRDGIGSGRIASLLQDQDGWIWAGSWTGGVGRMPPRPPDFITFDPDMPATSGLRDASVLAMCADASAHPSAQNRLWLATRQGLYQFDLDKARLSAMVGGEALFSSDLACSDELWVGSTSGLYRVKDQALQRIALPAELGVLSIRFSFRIDGPRLWLCDADTLWVLDRATAAVLAKHSPVSCGLIGRGTFEPFDDNIMLVGTSGGLLWFSRDGARLLHRTLAQPGIDAALQASTVTEILRARDGRWWIGTQGAGLHEMKLEAGADPAQAKFQAYGSAEGLAADAIGGILEDARGRLWLSTTRGISRFDPNSFAVRNYSSADGALDASYYIGSAAALPSGRFVFGGLDGFTVFDPEQVDQAPIPTQPVLTSIESDNRPLLARTSDPNSPLETSAPQLQSLALQSNRARNLSFNFTSPYFVAPHQMLFAYRLQGFESNWVVSDAQRRRAHYTNLAPGAYRFQVRAGNRDGEWSPPRELQVEILPQWWQTAGFKISVAASLLFLLFSAFRWRTAALARRGQELQEQVAARTADILKLGEIGRRLTATLDLEQAFSEVHAQVASRLDAHVFAISVLDREREALRDRYSIEAGVRDSAVDYALSETNRPAVWCVTRGQELCTACRQELANYVGDVAAPKQGHVMESIVYLPLRVGDRTIGCLSVQSPRPRAYSSAQLELLRALASYAAIAVDNAQTYEQLDKAMAQVQETLQRLQQTQARLITSEKLAATGQLTAGMAHEINNPNNFINGAAQNLAAQLEQFRQHLRHLAGQDAPPEVLALIEARIAAQLEELATIREGSQRIAAIVEDLRTYSRLDEAERKVVRLAESLAATISLARGRYRGIDIQARFDVDPQVECQPAKLNHVFMNLITNACQAIESRQQVEATHVGCVVVHARLGAADELQICVEDNGCGISPADQSHVFEPFFTTRPPGQGAGLGLSVAWNIVREDGGRLDLESDPQWGTRLVVVLPLRSEVDAHAVP